MRLHQSLTRIGLIALPVVLTTTMVAGEPQGQQGTTFRAETNYVSTDVIVRDSDGQFIPDLRLDEFRVLEDGVPQTIERFVRVIGGRSYTEQAGSQRELPSFVPSEGLILPRARQTTDASGRIFIILVDDLHLQVGDTPRVKAALRDIRDNLIHDNDLVGFVSTGPSSIEINPTYDFGQRRFSEAIDKVMGAGMSINEIIESAGYEGSSGPPGLRHNTHVAFETAYRMMEELAKINDRRKTFIFISSGYTFDPFREGRYASIQMRYQAAADTPEETVDPKTGLDINRPVTSPFNSDTPLADPAYMQRTEFSEADLISELAQLTREARRANVVFYALDPRGLTAGVSIEVRGQITHGDWRDYIMTQGNSLRVLTEETGGFAIIQTNDYTKGLQRIDAETSDYYVIGYTSTNPDPFQIRREVRIEIERPGVSDIIYRNSYTIPRPGER